MGGEVMDLKHLVYVAPCAVDKHIRRVGWVRPPDQDRADNTWLVVLGDAQLRVIEH